MNFMSQLRYNPKTQKEEWYYRIKESYRDQAGRPRNRVMLNVGFIPEAHRPEDIRDIGKCLTYKHSHQNQPDLFEGPFARHNEFVQRKTEEFWTEMVNNGSIDAVKEDIRQSREKARRLVDVDTVKHTDAREIGAEWICLQAIRELEIDKFLEKQGLSEVKINTALAHLITRTVYSPSELKSVRIMDENSAVCELVSGRQDWCPGRKSIYNVAPSLYELKEQLESHLCRKTDDLFNITNRIAIFDLTNFYFEGRKDGRQQEGAVRAFEGKAHRQQAACACALHQQGRFHTLFLHPCRQHGRPEFPSRHGGHTARKDTCPERPEGQGSGVPGRRHCNGGQPAEDKGKRIQLPVRQSPETHRL